MLDVGGQVTTAVATPMISMHNVDKHFGQLHVLKNIELEVPPGQVVIVLGPSGSGKSTLCRTINRLESIDSGQIQIDGVSLPSEGKALAQLRSDVGMVFSPSTCSRTRRSCRTSRSDRSRFGR